MMPRSKWRSRRQYVGKASIRRYFYGLTAASRAWCRGS